MEGLGFFVVLVATCGVALAAGASNGWASGIALIVAFVVAVIARRWSRTAPVSLRVWGGFLRSHSRDRRSNGRTPRAARAGGRLGTGTTGARCRTSCTTRSQAFLRATAGTVAHGGRTV